MTSAFRYCTHWGTFRAPGDEDVPTVPCTDVSHQTHTPHPSSSGADNVTETVPYTVVFQFPKSKATRSITIWAALPAGQPDQAARLVADMENLPMSWLHSVTEGIAQ